MKILMVCMGNICRSPTAEVVLRHKLTQHNLAAAHQVDSAGTHAYHIGAPADGRSQQHAKRRGYDLSALRGRQVTRQDFADFDLLLAMDEHNIQHLQRIAPQSDPSSTGKIRLLMDYAVPPHPFPKHVPDPYYDTERGFETVLDCIEAACEGLVHTLRRA